MNQINKHIKARCGNNVYELIETEEEEEMNNK